MERETGRAASLPEARNPGTTSPRRRAELLLLTTTLIWGGTFSAIKVLLDEGMQPMGILIWRFGTASLIFWPLAWRRIRGRLSIATIRNGAVLGVLLYLGFGLQTLGLEETSSSRSGFITALYVAFTPFLQTMLTRKAPSRRALLGVSIVLLGLWGLTAPGGAIGGLVNPWTTGGFNVGDLLTLACALAFALYIVALDRFSTLGDFIPLTAVQLLTVAICALVHLAVTEPFTMPSTLSSWGLLIYLAIFATVISTFLQTRYQRDTTPTRAAIIFTMESVFAAIIAALWLEESLGPVAIIGGGLILIGLLIIELSGREKE